jgi:hypothetical protein
MQNRVYLRSPLTVISMTIVLLTLIGALIIATVALEWLPPVWAQMVLLLQGVALLVVLMAYHWRPSWRLSLYPVFVIVTTLLWYMTPSHSRASTLHVGLPLTIVVSIIGDLAVTWRQSLPFTPERMLVHGGYVNVDEAAYFFRVPPDILRLHFANVGRRIHSGPTRQEYVELNDLLAVLATLQEARPDRKHAGNAKTA